MKRIIYCILCLLTCMTLLTACGDSPEQEDNTPVQSEASDNNQTEDKEEDDDRQPEIATEETSKAEEVPVVDVIPSEDEEKTEKADSADAEEEENDDIITDEDGLTDAQENVADSPEEEFHTSGTFNGFIDNSSVEITMPDGSYQTFFVYDETVYNRLMSLSEQDTPPVIQFVYKSRDGQVNPEIISVN